MKERTITTEIANTDKNKIILINTISNKKCFKNMGITSKKRRNRNRIIILRTCNMHMDTINININKNANAPNKKEIKN